ncbi:heparan-alpha-glucosaminide N-acetyltransferase domain-containing protein [Oxalobacteraceae bacterium OTU3CAMAD1]|nr:heparan-alpha-glucosaminide N-acetyltransferase domain-containing protein [Oxalobacteraceae bacterium OTU3CAMAD1]
MDHTSTFKPGYPDRVKPPQAAVLDPAAQLVKSRIAVIDVLRGLVMLIMLFDHVREAIYLHVPISDPMTVDSMPPDLFFTRAVAHFCAPMFVFLTGLSAWLYAHPAAGPRDATGFLFKRGLLLMVLELVVVNFAWVGKFPQPVMYLQVIWVIGLAMIFLALVHKLPLKLLGAVGALIVAGHNALTWISFEPGSIAYDAWTLLLHRGFLVADGAVKVKVTYPLLPWIGVILLGYAAGPLYARAMAPERRRQLLRLIGGGALLLLLVLRGFNIYGEELPWVQGETAVQTLMSFLNFTKYPPSLDFVLMTIGTGMLVLAWLEPHDNWLTRAFATFGGAPMFYYLFHLLLLLYMQKALVMMFGANHGTRFGVDSLWPVWVVAVALMPVLYVPCKAFANFKRTSKQAWVRYF